ncbi:MULTISPECIES: hypothetical protein [Nocardiopsis]|uniref:Putative membrane-anchored protein n=1 Tax=Nocardiopsis sinuspersici TaxID=501010 RepID=A0A1V3BYB2_9ACTN|nr:MULTISPECIES: hypothetical protein [Nocardiopsis]NYH54796.1 putative membrane-anchored protein [Nocardiopsis sinuspersici]OOC53547.1 hypothetical protein NOSIN_06805 [Nocardiopsis sinuspersici]
MAVAALITWLVTAVGGFVMLGTWIAKGGPRKQESNTRLPPSVVFAHFALAVVGLVVWIVYLFTDDHAIAWTGFVLLLPVAVLGFVMLFRWIPTYRARATAAQDPPERHFPVAVVGGHGVFAVATLILVLLASLGL